MSIKKLFDSADKNTNFSDYANEKERYEFVESIDNAEQITIKNKTFTPIIDYSNPVNFIKYGSAYYFYQGALTKISDYYPYDGSAAEKNTFYNSLLEGEKYIFDSLYPTTTGYALFSADGWGSLDSSAGTVTNGFGYPANEEYITVKGGPLTSSGDSLAAMGPDPYNSKIHHANIYDENIYQTANLPDDYGKGTRLSNLRSDFDDGVTVEFWLKKIAFDTDLTQKEVIFDLWNNNAIGSSDNSYGRVTLTMDGGVGSSTTPFKVTVQSGSTNIYQQAVGASPTLTTIQSWNHYAFVLQNSGSDFHVKLYVNGDLDDDQKVSSKTFTEISQKGIMGRIGALLTASQPNPSSIIYPQAGNIAGGGKLSASVDEFRFWKVARNSQQINRNWFDNVDGGVNTDISNTTLGIYYKFNEGIVGSSSIDSVVLDYAGRISNGVWTGYDSYSRNTGSAIVSASAAIFEKEDPIIKTQHPSYTSLSSSLITSGSFYDLNNNSSFISYAPSWVIEDHENNGNENLKIVSHIIGTYFDKLYYLIKEVPKLRHSNHLSSSTKPIPFARHLPQSLGLYTPDTFINSTIVEKLLNRNETDRFEGSIEDTKNEIYVNLYNNLTNIYKSKGTSKAIKNVFRCFNLDDSLVKFKQYSTNQTYELDNNALQNKVFKDFINFNTSSNVNAVVYQAVDSSNSDSSGYISGSYDGEVEGVEQIYGATVEAEVMFPFYIPNNTYAQAISREPTEISLFGITKVDTGSAGSLNGTDTTDLSKDNYSNFQVFAIREKPNSKNVYFKLTSSFSPHPIPLLTSSVFYNVYDNNLWNFSVRVKPSGYPMSGFVSGATTYTYDVIFKGINNVLGTVINSFEVSSSIGFVSGSNFLRSPKRVYVGAKRENLTGSVQYTSDVLASNAKYWVKFLDDYSLTQHSKDTFNQGISSSYQNISGLAHSGSNLDLLNRNTLALDWNFDNVTSSDSSGNFIVTDYGSGSALIRRSYGWLGRISGYQHTGYGYGFIASSDKVINKKEINVLQIVDPEQSIASEMINILDEDDTVFTPIRTVPNYLFTLEKSMYGAISQEMLTFLAGVIDFNNIIGAPVNRYRERYKDLEKLKEAFFRRVTKTSNVEKFVDYYKWFDDAISIIVEQLIPASADYIPDLMNIIEPHALERDKYQSKFPTLEFKQPEIENAPIKGITEKVYSWRAGHSTIPHSHRDTNKHMLYWKDRAERNATEITSSNTTVDTQREAIRKIAVKNPGLTSSIPSLQTLGGTKYLANRYKRRTFQKIFIEKVDNPLSSASFLHGGVNFEPSKNIHFTYNALYPAGPVDRTDGVLIPQNILLSWMDDLVKVPVNNDPKPGDDKTKRHVKVLHGRNYTEGLGYQSVKSSMAFPFNIISSSVKTGYSKLTYETLSGNVTITNLHNDVYGPDMDKPMQGPFTEYAVGGHQSRHIRLNTGSDNWQNRPEAWKLFLGACADPLIDLDNSGAIGMAGADYPWPVHALAPGRPAYPMTASQKAVYYRDFVAKRPVNIRNIKHTTGSTVLGNYNKNYDVVHTFGAFSNPRGFIENQPSLPTQAFQNTATSSTSIRTLLNIRRADMGHTDLVGEYSNSYLTSATNKSVIRTKFSAPGGIETSTSGYTDIRSNEFSVYNNINYRNLNVRRPFQAPSGSGSSSWGRGKGTTGIRVFDIHGKDFGLTAHLSRHAGRFGRDSVFQTGSLNTPGIARSLQAPGASYDQLPSFNKTNRNRIHEIKLRLNSNDGVTYDAFTSSIHDNYYVAQQIPKSTLQYSWISSSHLRTNERFGIVRPGFRLSASSGMKNSIDFVSASEFVSYHTNGSQQRVLGQDGRYAAPQKVVTDFVGLNINIVDTVLPDSATLGSSTTATDYINTDFIELGNSEGTASILNALLLNRGGVYGYPSWQQMRYADHKLIKNYREANKLHFITSTSSFNKQVEYSMPPVSLRGRALDICFDDLTSLVPYTTTTGFPPVTEMILTPSVQSVRADFSNNYVYFNLDLLENEFDVNYFNDITAGEQVLKICNTNANFNLNWAIYRENIFPSQRNEFVSQSRTRVGYENKYWRDLDQARAELGATFNNSQDIHVSQSSWILDAPTDFLTRTGPTFVSYSAVPLTTITELIDARNTLRRGGFSSASAGELQNTYFTFFTSSDEGKYTPSLGTFERGGVLTPGALYARKQSISSPRSIASPSGMAWPHTGAGTPGPFDALKQIDVCAGEAKWEAGEKAGISGFSRVSSAESFELSEIVNFTSMPSKPWFNDYDEFNYLVRKVSNAKEFAVVPEFRISEHIEDYTIAGTVLPESKFDTFEIPGTELSSSQDDFYIDYSNSEFLKEFLNVQSLSNRNAKEIRLVCSGTIRYNPYKSFYPAQRTVDLVKMFHREYAGELGNWGIVPGYGADGGISGSAIKSLYQPLFAPGILYNSIKSGLAVDWPIITEFSKHQKTAFGDGEGVKKDNYAATIDVNFGSSAVSAYWDKRLDFESLTDPLRHIHGIEFMDMDSHPSSSVTQARYRALIGLESTLYPDMARNFFGEVPNFFLKNRKMTTIKSAGWEKQAIPEGTYASRIILRRSMSGSRDYSFESGSANATFPNQTPTPSPYIALGARQIVSQSYDSDGIEYITSSDQGYPIPQDPINNPNYRESFTMYSRPTAFGPPIAGLSRTNQTATSLYGANTIFDSFNGCNPAYTPPYYNGQAWCDLIFRPTPGKEYSMKDIIAETSASYWRIDPGYPSASALLNDAKVSTVLVYDDTSTTTGIPGAIYAGAFINKNCMQLSASIQLFGIETVPESEVAVTTGQTRGTVELPQHQRWVIKPKFETPMLNFNDTSKLRALTSSEIAIPAFGAESVPRGMWHQFGIIEPDNSKGIFLEISDIPATWIKSHYTSSLFDSIYNNFDKSTIDMPQSLGGLVGWTDNSKRLGEIKDLMTVYEAVVAVPYIINSPPFPTSGPGPAPGPSESPKMFISIPSTRYEEAMNDADAADDEDMEIAGASIRRQVDLMQKYIFPPELDFISTPSLEKIAMYIFEFEYTFDQDDLSYIWQNLAPRDYQKITQQATTVSHELIDAELLTEENLEEGESLRWMIFKVKQRSQKDYDQIKANTSLGVLSNFAGATSTAAAAAQEGLDVEEEPEYNTMYNWPYDYLSFVEKIRLDVEVLFEGESDEPIQGGGTSPSNTGTTTFSGEAMIAAGISSYQTPTGQGTAQYTPQPQVYGGTLQTGQTTVGQATATYDPERSSPDESDGGGDPSY